MIDWNLILLNLRSAGMTYEKISKACNIDAQAIGHIARYETKEPKFSVGLKLLDLHLIHCKNKHNLQSLLLNG